MSGVTNDRREVLAVVLVEHGRAGTDVRWNSDELDWEHWYRCACRHEERSDVARPHWFEAHVAAALDAALAAQEGERGGAEVAAAVEALHTRRETPIYDDEECAEGSCGHEAGTCVILTPAVCGHCADQTEPGEAWEHMVREAAFWPCATIRALRITGDQP